MPSHPRDFRPYWTLKHVISPETRQKKLICTKASIYRTHNRYQDKDWDSRPRVVERSKFWLRSRCRDFMLDASVPSPSMLRVTTCVDLPLSCRGCPSRERRLRRTCHSTNMPTTPSTASPCTSIQVAAKPSESVHVPAMILRFPLLACVDRNLSRTLRLGLTGLPHIHHPPLPIYSPKLSCIPYQL